MHWFCPEQSGVSYLVTTSGSFVQYTHCHGDGCVLALLQSASVAANLLSGLYVYMRLMVYELALSANFDLPYKGFVLNRVVSYMVATSGSYVQYTCCHGRWLFICIGQVC